VSLLYRRLPCSEFRTSPPLYLPRCPFDPSLPSELTDSEIGLHFLFRTFNLRTRHYGRRQWLVRMGNGVAHLCAPRGWNKRESPLCMCVCPLEIPDPTSWREERGAVKVHDEGFVSTWSQYQSFNPFHAKDRIYFLKALLHHVVIYL
jgi:hypothetical protein